MLVSSNSSDTGVANPDTAPAAVTPAPSPSADRCKRAHVDIEDLNLQGADASFPPFADSVTRVDNPVRRAMLCYDATYRIFNAGSFTYNLLDPPVAKSQVAFVGERPNWSMMTSYSLNADLKSIHLPGYLLTLTGFISRTSWYPASPKSLKMATVILYKPFYNKRLELKGGYQDNDSEFMGMQVGGSLSSGSQGVYAVLPYEVGLSYMPLSAPTFMARAQPKGGFYGKAGVQRSVSPNGGQADIARDFAGFRFDPKGDGLLSIFEGGYKRDARADAPEFWVRGGYMTNTTRYANLKTNTNTSGNYCAFLLADRQLTRDSAGNPRRGLYLGGSAINVPAEMNAYSRYYELRLYQIAPFRSRPGDTASMVSTYSDYSRFVTAQLLSAGKTAATHSATISASYSIRA